MLEVNILRKVLEQFHRNKVYVPQVACVKDKIKAMFYDSKGFRLRFCTSNINALKDK